MRGLDLYAGVGGWALGLKLANIEIVSSFDRWSTACATNSANNLHDVRKADLRKASLSQFDSNVDIVVGSPPCTQFSMSNRGGAGDIQDGMQDIHRFLEIVDHIQPKYWVMENVPRVAAILQSQFDPGGALARFAHLRPQIKIVNAEDFGIPQRRRRCLIGNIDFELFTSYSNVLPRRTLADVIEALDENGIIRDPIFGTVLARSALTDHEIEDDLDEEEVRINSAAKLRHPIYNAMSFPDRINRAARTITATCTRVSRESIIVPSKRPNQYRRLSVRERACVQGFPISFQFLGSTHSQKLKMVGNAFPPPLSFYVGMAIRGITADKLVSLQSIDPQPIIPTPKAPNTPSARINRKYPGNRRFRFAIPSLQLKSGVRFELANNLEPEGLAWRVEFYFGTPQSTHRFGISNPGHTNLALPVCIHEISELRRARQALDEFIYQSDIARLQDVWSHRGPGGTRPFALLDFLSECGREVTEILHRRDEPDRWHDAIRFSLLRRYGAEGPTLIGSAKLYTNAELILSGLLVGTWANEALIERERPACVNGQLHLDREAQANQNRSKDVLA